MCLSKATKDKIKGLSQEIKQSLKIVIEERDKIREVLSEMEAINASINDAIEDFESGLDNLSLYI